MNKLIGIVGWSTGAESLGVSKPYLEYFKSYSDNLIILTPNSVVENLDLLVIPGGKDIVNSGGGDFSFWNSDAERFLEHFDRYTLPKYIEMKTPIYGICRGMQTIIRHFGGKLIQNISEEHKNSKDTEDTKVNKLIYTEKYKSLSKDTIFVGSWHHQACDIKDLPREFDLIAHCDNLVEFAKHKTLPIIIEQSHPERNWEDIERIFINTLLEINENKN